LYGLDESLYKDVVEPDAEGLPCPGAVEIELGHDGVGERIPCGEQRNHAVGRHAVPTAYWVQVDHSFGGCVGGVVGSHVSLPSVTECVGARCPRAGGRRWGPEIASDTCQISENLTGVK